MEIGDFVEAVVPSIGDVVVCPISNLQYLQIFCKVPIDIQIDLNIVYGFGLVV